MWNFNSPGASHHGGAWERLIRSIRKVLSSVTSEQVFQDESLSTLMCMVESTLNSRPLTIVSEDPKDMSPITPNHLLLLNPNTGPLPVITDKADIYGKRWKHIQYLSNLFWRRWTSEYLPGLQTRSKWSHLQAPPQVNDIVILIEPNSPRNSWPMGRISETFPSNDGLIRSVNVKTQTGTYKRPITKICNLECLNP